MRIYKIKNPKIGRPRGNCLHWLGHQPFCWHQVLKSERAQCHGWVGAPHFSGSSSFDHLVAYSAFAVGVIANIYGRLFRGNAFAVMVRAICHVFGLK